MKVVVPLAIAGLATLLAFSPSPALALTHAEAQAQCKAEYGGAAGRHAADAGMTRNQMVKACVKKAMHGAKHGKHK